MYDKNAADLIGTIIEKPRYKKTANTGKSKVDFVMKIHRPTSPNSYDRVCVKAWEGIADQVNDAYGEGDRIEVKGKINVSSYKTGETYHFFTRVVAEEINIPSEEKEDGFGYVKVPEETKAEKRV